MVNLFSCFAGFVFIAAKRFMLLTVQAISEAAPGTVSPALTTFIQRYQGLA